MTLLLIFTFSGFIDTAYLVNGNHPTSHENFVPGTGTSGNRANELTLNLAQVQWTSAVTEEQPVGFTLAVAAGDGERVVHAAEDFRYVYQASLAYRVRDGLLLEAGVFPCHIGFESFYSKDNWNYTRSWLGELSPYHVAGVKASYAFNSRWSGQLHVLNGWQIIHDNNGGKSIGAQVAYANGPLTASLNTWVGPELANDDDTLRKLVDLVAVYRITSRLQLGTSIDLGRQERANWRGIAAYARYALSERHAIALRAEQFHDPRNGISGASQALREATLTYELRPHDHLILKLETRYDRSTARVFSDDKRRQSLAIASAVVTF